MTALAQPATTVAEEILALLDRLEVLPHERLVALSAALGHEIGAMAEAYGEHAGRILRDQQLIAMHGIATAAIEAAVAGRSLQ